MSKIEEEIVEATNFEPPREYEDRQDLLAALARAVNKMDAVDFDTLSTETVDWFNDAVLALNNKKDLPDFPDVEDENDANVGVDAGSNGKVDDDKAETNAKTTKRDRTAAKEVTKSEPKRRPKGVPPKKLDHPKIDPQASIDNFETDSYGVVKGSKNAAAVALLEKGCRMSDITASIGGTYYNLVSRLQKQGHSVDKGANGMIKLTHKDA